MKEPCRPDGHRGVPSTGRMPRQTPCARCWECIISGRRGFREEASRLAEAVAGRKAAPKESCQEPRSGRGASAESKLT